MNLHEEIKHTYHYDIKREHCVLHYYNFVFRSEQVSATFSYAYITTLSFLCVTANSRSLALTNETEGSTPLGPK
jgi:hypothetical protein